MFSQLRAQRLMHGVNDVAFIDENRQQSVLQFTRSTLHRWSASGESQHDFAFLDSSRWRPFGCDAAAMRNTRLSMSQPGCLTVASAPVKGLIKSLGVKSNQRVLPTPHWPHRLLLDLRQLLPQRPPPDGHHQPQLLQRRYEWGDICACIMMRLTPELPLNDMRQRS
jgi:hypothetical protein